MSRTLLRSLVAACSLLSTVARGAEFSWEVAGLTSDGHHGSLKTENSSLQATHYLRGVDDSIGPYSLARFLDPASSVSVTLGHSKFIQQLTAIGPVPFPVSLDVLSREAEKSIGGRYVLPQSKWYFGGTYTTTDIDSPVGVGTNFVDGHAYGLLAGKYLGPTTSLEATIESSDTRGESPSIACVGTAGCVVVGTIDERIRQDHASIGLLHVASFRALRYSLSGRIATTSGHVDLHQPAFTFPIPSPPPPFGGATTIPANSVTFGIPQLRSYSVGGELFPTTRIGIRVGYTRWDDETAADHAYDVAATWFFRRNVGLRFAFSRQHAGAGLVYTDVDFQNMDIGTLGVIGRF